MLVVWDDDPEKIIEHTYQLESLLIATIWNNGANYADEEKNITVESLAKVTDDLENLNEDGSEKEPRRVRLLSPLVVALTIMLIFSALGVGWRKLVLETQVDGNYLRLTLMLTSPIFFFLGIVCFSFRIFLWTMY